MLRRPLLLLLLVAALLLGCLRPKGVLAQGTSNSTTPSNSSTDTPSPGTGNGNCFLTKCSNPQCSDSTPSRAIPNSPTTGALVNLAEPVNVTWSFAPSADPTYPLTGTYIYYRPDQAGATWSLAGVVARGSNATTLMYQFPPMQNGPITLLILPDNVWTLTEGVGVRPSCIAPNFPIGDRVSVVGYNPGVLRISTNPFPPNVSGAGASLPQLLVSLLASLAMVTWLL